MSESAYETRPKRPNANSESHKRHQSPQPKPKRADLGSRGPRPGGQPGHASNGGHQLAPAVPLGRATPLEPVRDFGERVAGSTSTQAIYMPWNLADTNAIATFHVRGAGFELLSPAGGVPMLTSANMKGADVAAAEHASPTISFVPGHAGEYQGELTVEIRWNDGHVETQKVTLYGRARTLQQAPAAFAPAQPHPEPQPSQQKQLDLKNPKARAIDRAFSSNVAMAKEFAANAAGALAGFQKTGVEIVKSDQATYQKQLATVPHSILWDLIEVALTMGTAGAAAVVAKALLPKIVAKLAGSAGEAVELGDFATDSIKEGLKTAGREAINARLPQADTGAKTPEAESGRDALSSNPRIEFFARQENVLVTQEEKNKNMVATFAASLQPLVASDPSRAIQLLEVLTKTFVDAGEEATRQQAEASSTQWATAVARATLGTERVNTSQPRLGASPLTATKTEALRPPPNRGILRPVDGVLDVYIAHPAPGAKVVGAKLHGVAQEIADRLKQMRLADSRMPMRFLLGSTDAQPTIITRDEAGRVRVQDALHHLGPREEESIAKAESIIDHVLSASLDSWGVEIQTDDASGRK